MAGKVTGGGRLDKFVRDAETAKPPFIEAGFFSTAKYQDGTPVAYVAAIQEYGYPEGRYSLAARSCGRPLASSGGHAR